MSEVKHISSIFIVCIIGAFSLGLVEARYFVWLKPDITILLGIIMFGMGLTLEWSDFKNAFGLKFKIILLIIIKGLD